MPSEAPDKNQRKSAEELGKLAHRLAGCKDAAEAKRLKKQIFDGFYGKPGDPGRPKVIRS